MPAAYAPNDVPAGAGGGLLAVGTRWWCATRPGRRRRIGNPQPTQEGLSRSSYVPWRYIAQHPWVNYQADLPEYPKLAYDAQQMLMPVGVADPTDGYFSATAWGKGQTADARFLDGVTDIILGRRPMSDYDDLVRAWQSEAGETVRKEFMDAMAAAKA